MHRVREILRLRWAMSRSVRQTATSVGVSRSLVSLATLRATAAGLTWDEVCGLDDGALDERLYGKRVVPAGARAEPDPIMMHLELKRPGVTLELLHIEYKEAHPDGFQYTAFCKRYRAWKKRAALSMRQTYVAGEKTFLDYSGVRPHYFDEATGARVLVELFVAVLGASSFTYVEATRTQTLADWVSSNQRMYRFVGGVSRAQVPDQLRSAVSDPDWFDPGINRTYQALATHYGTSVFPARPRKPQDKAKVEVAVLIAQRWILARIRNETFFSLAELNARIRVLNDELNLRPMKRLGGRSRRDIFEQYERDAMLPLPSTSFEYSVWSKARVHPDYHVQIDDHYYSVPSHLVHEVVEVRLTGSTIELLHKYKVVATHVRSRAKHTHTTTPEHMPANHRAWAQADPAGIQEWAASTGPMTEAMVQRILESRPIMQQGLRSAMGLRRIGQRYGPDRTEAACALALRFGATSYKPVERLLKLGREGGANAEESPAPIEHDNVRGPESFT